MRKISIIVVLLSAMALLLGFEVVPEGGAFHPKVLAALGFILLCAYTFGAIAQRVGLPQVVGYIITGVLFGPHLTQLIFGEHTKALFNEGVVDDIKIINGLAIGLIGLTAGGELKLHELKKDAKSIAAIISAQTLIVPLLVGSGIFALGRLFPSTLPFLTSTTALGAAALVFGTLAVGTSPATTLAVVTETRAKGPLTNLLLGSVISKDATTVLFFLISLQIAAGLVSGSAFDAGAIAWELGMSVFVGMVMGLVIILYLRFVDAELVLFTVTVVFVGQALAQQYHLEALLAFIVAGFIVENGPGGQGERMIHELERLSLPVFVVFFTVAAARLELAALADYWPVALVYISLRSVGMVAGTWLGTKVTRTAPVARAHIWYAYFPQAGVTLSLAALLAGKIAWAAEFETIVMATILVHIIVGPILAKLALTRSGEAAATKPAQVVPLVDPLAKVVAEELGPPVGEVVARARAETMGDVQFVVPDLEHDVLNQHANRLRVRLERILDDTENTYFKERERRLRDTFTRVEVAVYEVLQETAARLEDLDELAGEVPAGMVPEGETAAWENRETLKRILRQGRAHLVEEVMDILVAEGTESSYTEPTDRVLQQFIGRVDEATRTERAVYEVPQERARRHATASDSAWVRGVKTCKRVLHPLVGRTRTINVEILHRCLLTLGLPTELVDTANFLGSERLYMWRKVRIFYGLADDIYQEALEHMDRPDLQLAAHVEPPRPIPIATTQEVRALNLADLGAWAEPTSVDIALIEDAIRAEPVAHRGRGDQTPAIHELAVFFESRIAELRQDGDRAREDMASFARDARRRLALSVARPYRRVVEAMHIAGTFELPDRSLTPSRRFEDYRLGRQGILTAIQNWRTLNTGFASSIALELEVRRVESRLREVLLKTLEDIDQELLSTLSYHAAEFGERVIEAQARLELAISPGGSVHGARKAVVQERALLLAFVHETALADIHELRESRRFSHLIDRLMRSLQHIVEDGPEIIRIATRESSDVTEGGSIEGLEVLEIPLQQVLREALEREVAVHLSDVELRLMGLIERVAAEILEVSRIVGFNLEAAAAELLSASETSPEIEMGPGPGGPGRRRKNRLQPTRTNEGELTLAGVELPTEFAIGGLERAGERLDMLSERIGTEGNGIEDSIRLEAVKQIRQVHELLSEGSPQALRRFLAQRDLQQGAGEIVQQAHFVARWSRTGYEWVKERLRPVRDDIRAELSDTPAEIGSHNLYGEAARLEELLEVWDRGNLPEIYRRLFSPTPTDVADFFIPRNEVLDDFRRAAVHWLQGHVCTIAVVGDAGAGRTSFIDYALHTTLEGLPTVRRSLNRTVTSEERLAEELSALAGGKVEKDLDRLKLRLRNRKDRIVAVVEQAEHLFLRSVDGMQTLRRFLWMVGETSDSVLWILSMNTHAWRFLDSVMQVSDTFTHVLPLRPLDPSELENLIMTRHRVSGYRLVFDEDLTGIRRLRHVIEALLPGRDQEDDPQELLRQAYFERLHEISGGNPMLGVYHWLRSVSQREGEPDLLHVSHVEAVDLSFLDRLDTDKLLALANVILHNGLSIKELAEVFRIEPQEAQAILGFLKGLRLLYVDPGAENHYRLHRVLQGAVVERLKTHKML